MSMSRNVYYLEQVDSTNEEVKRLLRNGASQWTVVVAETQSRGKGRRGKMWSSPPGQAVYMSLGLLPEFSGDKASMLTLVAALAVNKGIMDIFAGCSTDIRPYIKWPNDIVVNGKKVCGILTEMDIYGQAAGDSTPNDNCGTKNGNNDDGKNVSNYDSKYSVIIGIGVNTGQMEFEEELRDKATSLSLETGQTINRKKLVGNIMKRFEEYYGIFLQTEDLSGLAEEYNQNLVQSRNPVTVMDPGGQFSGVAKGINQKGELLVETKNNQIVSVYAGEVSVRGIYGYI